jgi:nucleoporin NDC1
MHCGEVNTKSQAEWVTKTFTGWRGWHTLAWYLYSAFFFGEVYIWSRADGAGLEWVDKGREYERARVNENPMFLRAVFLCLAVAQTALHLSRGEDRVPVPAKDEDPMAAHQREYEGLKWKIPTSVIELWEKVPMIVGRVVKLAIPGFAFTLPTYFVLLRPWFWPYYYTITRTFFRSLPPSARPTGIQHIPTLSWQSLTSSFMLISLWELSNAAFTIFVARPPLAKSGVEPLTGGATSKDPNGSLLSGLRSKKEVPRTFAFWELSMICQFFESRRKTIYTEVDRANGSTWTQISQLCIAEITAIQTRIGTFQQQDSPAPLLPAPSTTDLFPPSHNPAPLGLPKIADRNVVPNGAVTTTPPQTLERTVGSLAKSLGQSPNSPNLLVPRARKALEWSAEHGLNRENLHKEAGGLLTTFLCTPVGEPLRQTFARRVKGVVLGTPYSHAPTIVHASRALATLCACSLKEDDYGQVAKSVALIIRTYVETITAVESFVRGLRPHWSDVFFSAREREVREVRAVVAALKLGLEEVVLAFGEYAGSVGVSKKELREARELLVVR